MLIGMSATFAEWCYYGSKYKLCYRNRDDWLPWAVVFWGENAVPHIFCVLYRCTCNLVKTDATHTGTPPLPQAFPPLPRASPHFIL